MYIGINFNFKFWYFSSAHTNTHIVLGTRNDRYRHFPTILFATTQHEYRCRMSTDLSSTGCKYGLKMLISPNRKSCYLPLTTRVLVREVQVQKRMFTYPVEEQFYFALQCVLDAQHNNSESCFAQFFL